VIFGALLVRSRPILRWLHIASLVWGILTELLPWPPPLTLLENWLEAGAAVEPYQDGFLLHYLDRPAEKPDSSIGALFFKAGASIVTMLLVIFDCATQPGIRHLQGASFLLREAWILELGKNVIEFRFQFLKLCTEHTTPFPP